MSQPYVNSIRSNNLQLTAINKLNQPFLNGKKAQPPIPANSPIVFISLIALFLVGSFQVFPIVQNWLTANSLEQNGVAVSGRVVNRQIVTKNSRLYYLTYSFNVTSDGKVESYQNEDNVSLDTYNKYQLGFSINIRYLPSNPAICEVAEQSNKYSANFFLILSGSLVYLIAGLLLWYILAHRSLYRQFARQGQILTGYVVNVRLKGGKRANSITKLLIEYRFTTPSGQIITSPQPFVYDKNWHDRLQLTFDAPMAIIYADPKHYKLL